jgi:CIC family chloride channel protein
LSELRGAGVRGQLPAEVVAVALVGCQVGPRGFQRRKADGVCVQGRAAAGISAPFNAPVTGVLFGCELILREFALDALVPMIFSAVVADVISRAFFGAAPAFGQVPHDLLITHAAADLLVAVLGLAAALIGVSFHAILYKVEDVCNAAWLGRPEWARPAVGGILLGLVLLAVPQVYGVGYLVMSQATAGNEALWFLLVLMAAKISPPA